MRELIEVIEASVGRKAVIEYQDAHPADVPSTWASIVKAAALLGWQPQVSLPDGVARAVAWYEAEREWAKDVRVY